jgi:hypothetical protein
MRKIWMLAAAILLFTVFGAGDAKADCHSCEPHEDGTICWSGPGPHGACITNWDTPEQPVCEPLSECPDDGGGGGGGGGGGHDPWNDDQNPACNGWAGCSAECSSCWY